MLSSNDKLKKFKETGRLPQAVLLITPEKNKRAELLEKTLLAFSDETISEGKGNLIIVGSLDEEESIKVDDVRDVLNQLSLSKWDSKSKRFVYIPGAEHLTASSSNALLKSLEEPGEGTHFILTSPSRKAVLKTIVSRCSVVNFYDEVEESNEEKKEGSGVFFDAFFKGDVEPLEKLNKVDFKLAFEDFKMELKDTFVEQSFSGDLDRSFWFALFDFIEKCETQLSSHTDSKWIIRSIEEFVIRNRR